MATRAKHRSGKGVRRERQQRNADARPVEGDPVSHAVLTAVASVAESRSTGTPSHSQQDVLAGDVVQVLHSLVPRGRGSERSNLEQLQTDHELPVVAEFQRPQAQKLVDDPECRALVNDRNTRSRVSSPQRVGRTHARDLQSGCGPSPVASSPKASNRFRSRPSRRCSAFTCRRPGSWNFASENVSRR
ncbi:hypothetical protein GCM10022222_71070 [Amycolatopsis ultiminotia]|uniref:Uncharacterized protein n=1 Tax=Amycolatopsis ultiminotia TaxID=543629 RepID=A0ABP6Y3P4_9PSEU